MAETATKHTKADKYIPTANEKKLIDAMSNPEYKQLNVSELCQTIGISRDTYYKTMRKPEFVAYYKQVQFEVIKGSVSKVLAATIEFAVNDPKCHQDRKMILEMGDMYTPKQSIDHSGRIDSNINANVQHDLSKLSDEELNKLESLLEKSSESQ